jgi:hypothetical protein
MALGGCPVIWSRQREAEGRGRHEVHAPQDRDPAADTPLLFQYERRGRRRLVVWADGTLEGKDTWGRTRRVSLVGAEAVEVEYDGDLVIQGSERVFAQQTQVEVRDRLGKTTVLSVPRGMPVSAKEQLERVAAGFAGQASFSLASAAAHLLMVRDEPLADQPGAHSAPELRRRARAVQALLASDPDDDAVLQQAQRSPQDEAVIGELAQVIHHRAERDPGFREELTALVRSARERGPVRWLDVIAGAGLGLAAAAVGGAGWFLLTVKTHAIYGLAAAVLGLLVGKAVVIGSGAARGRLLQAVSVGVTLLSLLVSQYFVARQVLIEVTCCDAPPVPLLILPRYAVVLVRDSVTTDPLTLVFWGLALWVAWRIPARREGMEEALRLPTATGRPWRIVGLSAGALVLVGVVAIIALSPPGG